MAKGTTADEKLKELEQKIHRLQLEKQKIKNQVKTEEKKKRDHAMILVGATLLTYFDDNLKEMIINGNDDEIKAWVHSLFEESEPETHNDEASEIINGEAPETEQY